MGYTHIRLGQILKRQGKLSGSQLVRALDYQKIQGGKLGQILISQEMVTEQDLLLALHEQLHLPIVDFRKAPVVAEAVALVPQAFAIEYLLLPLVIIEVPLGKVLVVAMEDPTHKKAIQALARLAGLPIKPLLAARSELTVAIRNSYAAFYKDSAQVL